MIFKVKKLNDTDAVVLSDKETKILLAKDLSCVVKVIDESKRVYFTTENITTQSVGASYYHTKEEEWYFLLATIAPYKIEGLPMLELLNQEEDVEKLAEKQVELEGWGIYEDTSEQVGIKNAFIAGYKAARKKYS